MADSKPIYSVYLSAGHISFARSPRPKTWLTVRCLFRERPTNIECSNKHENALSRSEFIMLFLSRNVRIYYFYLVIINMRITFVWIQFNRLFLFIRELFIHFHVDYVEGLASSKEAPGVWATSFNLPRVQRLQFCNLQNYNWCSSSFNANQMLCTPGILSEVCQVVQKPDLKTCDTWRNSNVRTNAKRNRDKYKRRERPRWKTRETPLACQDEAFN